MWYGIDSEIESQTLLPAGEGLANSSTPLGPTVSGPLGAAPWKLLRQILNKSTWMTVYDIYL